MRNSITKNGSQVKSTNVLRLLTPALKAYGLTYTSTTAPRLLKVLLVISRRQKGFDKSASLLYAALIKALAYHEFPIFCGAIVGCYTLLQIPIRQACKQVLSLLTWREVGSTELIAGQRRFSRFVAAFFSAGLCLRLLNRPRKWGSGDEGDGEHAATGTDPHGTSFQSSSLAGDSIDLTLFTVARAMDATITTICRQIGRNQVISNNRLTQSLSSHADTILFALSSGTIMWTWFYTPSRLPREYNKWIGEVAQVDPRLIEALRKARAGEFVYGQDRGADARMLQGMCKEYGWPVEWGDPERTVPIPCEMVHMGAGPNCHWHTGVRFMRTFRFALATNLPLQLVMKGIIRRRMSTGMVQQATKDAVRSSAFLGALVALMYYGICLSRTVVGPRIFSRGRISPQMWDAGLGVRAACILCGWSILLEARKRRQELATFVAPRALATQLPREYDAKHFWRERLAFSVGTAIVFTLVQEDSRLVRGLLGRVLSGILET